MKSIIKKISRALQVILMAPVKLPAKIAGIVQYLALGLGIVESVLDEDDKVDSGGTEESSKLEVGNSDKAQEIDEVEPVEDHIDEGRQLDQAESVEESTMPAEISTETSDLDDLGKEGGHADQ